MCAWTEEQVAQLISWANEVITTLKTKPKSPTLSRTSTLGGDKPWVNLFLPVVDKLLTFLTDKTVTAGTKVALSNTASIAFEEAQNLLASAIVSGDTGAYQQMAQNMASSYTDTTKTTRETSIAFKSDLVPQAANIEHPWRPSNFEN